MGNAQANAAVEVPKPTKIKDDEVLLEIKRITLDQLRECIYFWKTEYNVQTANKKDFENLFGHLVKDSDIHYELFKSDYEHCASVFEYIAIAILLCKTNLSLYGKIEFIFSIIVVDLKKIMRDDIIDVFKYVMSGFTRLFHIYRPSTSDIEKYIDNSGISFSQQVLIQNKPTTEKDPEKAKPVDEKPRYAMKYGLTYEEVWMWFQDRKAISLYVDAIIGLNNIPSSLKFDRSAPKDEEGEGEDVEEEESSEVGLGAGLARIAADISDAQNMYKIKTEDADILSFWKKRFHPLFNTYIVRMNCSSWDTALPEVSSEDCVFTVMEHCLLGGFTHGIPVFQSNDPDGAIAASLQTLTATTQTAPVVVPVEVDTDLNAPRTGRRLGILAPPPLIPGEPTPPEKIISSTDQNARFICCIDMIDMLGWFATCVPDTVSNSISINQYLLNAASEIPLEPDESDDAPNINATSGSKRRSTVSRQGVPVPQQSNGYRQRRISSNTQQASLKVWQTAGIKTSLSPVKHIWDKLICPFNEPCPVYSYKQIIQMHNTIYDAVLLFAKGYRVLPLASLGAAPYKVTHMITGLDMVEFMRTHPDLLGTLYKLPVKRTRLIKRAITLKSTMNLG